MTKELLPPIRWMGGKTRQRDNILPILESIEHTLYCEPFGGSAAILIAKKKVPVEVYNDWNGLLVNLFRELRRQTTPDIFRELARVSPMSREIYQEFKSICLAFWKNDFDALDKLLKDASLNRYRKETAVAFCFFYCMRLGFGGKFLDVYGGGEKIKYSQTATRRRSPDWINISNALVL